MTQSLYNRGLKLDKKAYYYYYITWGGGGVTHIKSEFYLKQKRTDMVNNRKQAPSVKINLQYLFKIKGKRKNVQNSQKI